MSIIQAQHLTKIYGTFEAISDLSFTIEENKITGLIGRNGAGKTTLLKMIAGYLKPSHGELEVFAQKPFNSLEVASKMMFIDDNMVFPDSLTLKDILTEVARFYQNWDQELATGLFDYFSLNPEKRYLGLSKGTKSLFNSIIGIASRSPLTIFDEPTTGMDSAVRKDFYRALLKDYLIYPRTIILSSHLLSELEEILEDILLIHEGKERLHLSLIELKEYAIALRGNAQAVFGLIQSEDIIYQEKFGVDSVYAVIKRDALPEKAAAIEVLPVTTDDLCVYLTAKTKGGIDDVFKRS